MPDQDPPPTGGQPGDDNWPTYSPPTSQPAPETPSQPTAPESLPPTHVPYGKQQSYGDYGGTYPPPPGSSQSTGVTIISSDLVTTRTRGCGVVGLVVSLLIFLPVIIGVVAGIRAISGGFDEIDSGFGDAFSPEEKVDMHTPEGFEALLDALREETGGTTVFSVGLYGEYATVDVPVDATSKRHYSYYFNGDIRKSSPGTSTYARFDLATIDPSVFRKLFNKARTLVENPKSSYLIIRAPGETDKGAWFSVYASNEFGESGYFQADKTGKIVFEYLAQ